MNAAIYAGLTRKQERMKLAFFLLLVALITYVVWTRHSSVRLQSNHLVPKPSHVSGNDGPLVGAKLVPLRGWSLAHNHIQVDLAHRTDNTVVFVLSPSCSYCRVNFHNWRDLEKLVQPHNIVWVDTTNAVTPLYLYSSAIPSKAIFISVDNDTAMKNRFSATPTTVVLDRTGTVQWSWSGVLNEPQMDELRRLLTQGNS